MQKTVGKRGQLLYQFDDFFFISNIKMREFIVIILSLSILDLCQGNVRTGINNFIIVLLMIEFVTNLCELLEDIPS